MKIIEIIGEQAALEQLAEECTELAHAALKQARVMRGENPTPVTIEEAKQHVLEEIGDIIACLAVLYGAYGFEQSWDIAEAKLKRWQDRTGATEAK